MSTRENYTKERKRRNSCGDLVRLFGKATTLRSAAADPSPIPITMQQMMMCSHPDDDTSSCMASKLSRATARGKRLGLRRSISKDGLASTYDRRLHLRSPTMDWPLDDDFSLMLPQSNDANTITSSRRERRNALLNMLIGCSRPWTVGRISVLLLLIFTLSDVALKAANAQIHHLDIMDSHNYYYDALSPDVIRPAFLYHHHPEKKRSLNLGSAAISKITDALGPILPFTGGVDLRRQEYYSEGWFENLKTIAKETYEAYANAKKHDEDVVDDSSVSVKALKKARGGGQVPQKVADKLSKKKPQRPSVLSATNSFVKLDEIADLTLKDLAQVFEYTMKSTQDGFNRGKFINSQSPHVKSVIQQMENAATKSRGKDIQPVKIVADASQSGDIDVFLFCAAMRIYAEWRMLRLVPDGYKGYAVGMQLGHKDVVQNVGKIEEAAHNWINYQLGLGYSESDISSPTMRDLLQFEKDTGVQPSEKLPRLKDGTGSMGLLWTKRQFDYQFEIFKKTLEVPTKFSTAKDAVESAYTTVYGAYHGWAVQKIFTYSFQASPPIDKIYKFMNPHRLREVEEAASRVKASPLVDDTTTETEDGSSDGEEEETSQDPPEKFFHRIGWQVDKFANVFGKVFAGDKNDMKKIQVRGGGGGQASRSGLQGEELEEFICTEMTKDANEHVASFISVAEPLAKDLASLFDSMNMNDPTKV